MTNRREFCLSLFAAAVVPWDGVLGAIKPVKSRAALSISNILQVSFPAVLRASCDGELFVSTQLNRLVKSGRLTVCQLGAMVDFGQTVVNTQQARIPIIWSQHDEDNNGTEDKKIELARALIVNGLDCMDDFLLMSLGPKRAVVSDQWRYALSPTQEVRSDGGTRYFVVKLYTAFAAEEPYIYPSEGLLR